MHLLGDAHPIVGSLLAHQLEQSTVLFRDPRATTVIRGHGKFNMPIFDVKYNRVSFLSYEYRPFYQVMNMMNI